MGSQNVIKLSEFLHLFYYIHYVCLGEDTLSGCYPTLGAPFVSHKSVRGRRKSIHPGAGLPDITLAAANHLSIGTPLKEPEVLSAYFSSFYFCFEVYLIPLIEVEVLFICLMVGMSFIGIFSTK
jgi:hypothetical protein